MSDLTPRLVVSDALGRRDIPLDKPLLTLGRRTESDIRVNGAAITPACPNHMDPPLHYVTAAGLDSLQVTPGVTPVSEGGDSIAGTVIAKAAPPQFSVDDSIQSFGLVGAGYNGAHRGGDARITVGAANQDVSAQYAGERLWGQNQILPDGEVRDSGYSITKQDALIAFLAERTA